MTSYKEEYTTHCLRNRGWVFDRVRISHLILSDYWELGKIPYDFHGEMRCVLFFLFSGPVAGKQLLLSITNHQSIPQQSIVMTEVLRPAVHKTKKFDEYFELCLHRNRKLLASLSNFFCSLIFQRPGWNPNACCIFNIDIQLPSDCWDLSSTSFWSSELNIHRECLLRQRACVMFRWTTTE